MKATLLSLALLGTNFAVPVSDRLPQLKVEALCRATTATDKAMGLAEAQSFDGCMRDETAAQQQLQTIWMATSRPVRDNCEGEATVGGSESYVDLLTCIQMQGIASAMDSAPKLRGASTNRNKKQ